MNARTLLLYQFGSPTAIRAVAENRNSILVGIVLVLLTAIARNYDQTHFTESWLWLFGPLIFSIFSGTFVCIFFRSFIRSRLPDDCAKGFLSYWRWFIPLFWMTAPVAWLYAIPTERIFNSYSATVANLMLLAIVSVWRVLLLSRVLAVLHEIPFFRAFSWVLLPALLEVVGVIFLGGLFSDTFGRKVMASMGGMRNSPEDSLLIGALSNVMSWAFFLLFPLIAALVMKRYDGGVTPLPVATRKTVPYVALILLTLAWIALAIIPQREQHRFITHARLISLGDYRVSIDYLSARSLEAFPPSRRLEPDPYERRAWEHLPKVIAALRPSDPQWVRSLYLDYLERLFTHFFLRGDPNHWADMFENLATLPEGKSWIERYRGDIEKESFQHLRAKSEVETLAGHTRLRAAMEKLQISTENYNF